MAAYIGVNKVRKCFKGRLMDLQGVVRNGVIVPDVETVLPEGTRVRISVTGDQEDKSFGERFAQFRGAIPGLPEDLARQHEHYRLGTPKR